MGLNPLFVNLIATAAMLAGLALAGWLAAALFAVRSREANDAEPGRRHEAFLSVPPALVIFYVFMFIFGVGYVLYIWLGGISY